MQEWSSTTCTQFQLQFQWACKDVLETIEAVTYHEVFIHSFGDHNTRGLQELVCLVNAIIPLYSLELLETNFAENQGHGDLRRVYIQNNLNVLGSVFVLHSFSESIKFCSSILERKFQILYIMTLNKYMKMKFSKSIVCAIKFEEKN